jgi:predicted RND superfamily exporter protein
MLVCIPCGLLLVGREFDANIAARFPDAHPIHRSLSLLEDKFTGGNSFELYVSGPPNELLTPDVIQGIVSFAEMAAQESHVLSVESVVDLFREIDRVVGYRTDIGLPSSRGTIAASLDWVDAHSPKVVQSCITADRDQLRVRVMLGFLGMRATNQMANQMTEKLSTMLGPSVAVTPGGTYQIIGAVVDDIVNSHIVGFFICVVSLTVIMIWGLGSVRVGLLAQIPNLIPVLLMMVVVALPQDLLDSDILALPMTGLGIAVDDTIHFLHRLRFESEQTTDRKEAVTAVFAVTGRSIVISTVGLAAALASADIISIWMIGTYLVVALFGALISDLLCLPAMIHLGLIRYRS